MGTSWTEVKFSNRLSDVLEILKKGPCTLRELATKCRCSEDTISRVTKVLIEQNRVTRTKLSFGQYRFEIKEEEDA